MRRVAFVLGGLLLIGGGALIVVADQERHAAVEQARQIAANTEQRLQDARAVNLRLAEQLTTLRSEVAELDELLSDEKGFLE